MPVALPSGRGSEWMIEKLHIHVGFEGTAPLALRQEMMYSSCRSEREGMSTTQRIELPQGTLDLLILQTLVLEPQHGWAISEPVQQIRSEEHTSELQSLRHLV